MTRNNQTDRFTIEKLTHDCLDIRELRRRDFLTDRRVEIGASIRWPKIARMTIEQYRIQLNFWRQLTTQYVRVSWTQGASWRRAALDALPTLPDPRCKALRWAGRLLLPRCIGNPPYASQQLSAQGRAHYQACKLRLLLDGQAQLSTPFPERPRNMHRRTYDRLRREGMNLEAGLSKRMRRRFPDYASLVAYTD